MRVDEFVLALNQIYIFIKKNIENNKLCSHCVKVFIFITSR